MITERLNARNYIVYGKSKKQKWSVIITFQTNAGKSIMSKPEFDIVPCNVVNEIVVYYPIIIVPEKSVIKIKKINKKAHGHQNKDWNKTLDLH